VYPSSPDALRDAAASPSPSSAGPPPPPSPLAAAAARTLDAPPPPPSPSSPLRDLARDAATVLVASALGGFSAFVTHVLNRTVVTHGERFTAAFEEAAATRRGVVTVCNHVTSVDDPGAVVPLVPASWLLQPRRLRWTLCARERCFSNPVVGAVLTAGRALPIDRGAGPLQPGMDAVVDLLDDGQWVHMFPEGSRRAFGSGLGRMRPGVGRLVADAAVPPLVLPFYHRGLHALMRRGDVLPLASVGNTIHIAVGRPLEGLPALIEGMRADGARERDIHVAVADRIGDALAALREEVEARVGRTEADEAAAIEAAAGRRAGGAKDA